MPQASRQARLSALDALFLSHIKNNRLSRGSSGSALATLGEIEALNPGKNKLDQYRRRIATRYAELATAALAKGDIKKAQTYVTTGRRISDIPTLVWLSGVIKREESGRKRDGRQARLSTLDALFLSHIKNDRLSRGSSGSALATLGEIEALNPGKNKLDQYRRRIATRYAELATAALAKGDIKKANTYVTTGRRISDIPTLVRLSGEIKREESWRKSAGEE